MSPDVLTLTAFIVVVDRSMHEVAANHIVFVEHTAPHCVMYSMIFSNKPTKGQRQGIGKTAVRAVYAVLLTNGRH